MKFELNTDQQDKLAKWIDEVRYLGVKVQKEQIKNPTNAVIMSWESGIPYSGAAGGQYTYSFTPTSLGIVCRAHDAVTGTAVDLTDYESW